MTRVQLTVFSTLAILAGAGTLFYLLTSVPPVGVDGTVDTPALVLFFIGLALTILGGGARLASVLHRQWPALAGASRRRGPEPIVALRQGALLAATFTALALLAYFQRLDVTFLLVALVLAGLIEAFIQNRK
jgi:hypothetical protein